MARCNTMLVRKMAEKLLECIESFNRREDQQLVLRINFDMGSISKTDEDKIINLYEERFGYGYEGGTL